MATVKNIKVNNYCDVVNKDLTAMKNRINALREDVKRTYGEESEVFVAHERHLIELADIIEWKLQILMKSCPFDYKGMDEGVETTVSVGPSEKAPTDFSGGYIGG